MKIFIVLILLLAIAALGVACYSLGHVNGYIEGYEQSTDYCIDTIKLWSKKR